MPAVEAGWILVDSAAVLALDARGRTGLVEWALSLGSAVLVTKPSLVVVESPMGPVAWAAGIGSLIAPREPPVDVRVHRLRRREWVDGCRVAGEPRVERARGGGVEASGTVAALDPSDPAALFVNAAGGRHTLHPVDPQAIPLAALDPPRGPVVLARTPEGSYLVAASRGEAAERLEYIAPLASACK